MCGKQNALVSGLSDMQPTRIAVPKVKLSVLFLQIATFFKSTLKDDPERVVSALEVLFGRYAVGNELVVSTTVR